MTGAAAVGPVVPVGRVARDEGARVSRPPAAVRRSGAPGPDTLPDDATPVDALWTVVIPVKAPAQGKTRLAPHLDDASRMALARAFAADTVAAALAARSVARVIVVGDDPELAHGAEFLDERRAARASRPESAPRSGRAPVAGLTAAIARGIAHARATGAVDVAVLLGDVPCLRPDDLDDALALAAGHPLAFVPDADGTGTTLATALAEAVFEPHFGADSAREHARAGFVALEASARLRRDVDTLDALEDAIALGTGAHTAHVVAALADHRQLPGAK
jgi:2-phospho-L-lactate guanylyltransferase